MRGRKIEKYNTRQKIHEIVGVKFGVMSPEEVLRRSVVEIKYPDLFETSSSSEPRIEGLMDPRLGPTNPLTKCATCSRTMETCPGHFGHIKLARAVYHPAFIDTVLKILRCTCHQCGRLLVYPGDIPENATTVNDIQQIIKTKRKKYSVCGTIITTKGDENDEAFAEWQNNGCKAAQYRYKKENMQIHCTLGDETHELTAQAALEILDKITEQDASRMGFTDPKRCAPKWFIITALPVPPPTVRPSLLMENKRGEDDLTFKLADIVKANNNVIKHEEKGTPPNRLSGLVGLVQFHVATYINNDYPNWGISQQRSHRPIKGILQRFHTKSGRLRGHLMGKRGDFTARTVIGGDPNVSIEELVMPEEVARTLTFPEKVNRFNREWLNSLIQNGPNEYPGARMIIKSDGSKIDLRYCTESIDLEDGDIVERHLHDGDVVIFNRQPSLHKMSMMGHRIRVMSEKTFRFSLAVTTPYNADYDGKLVAVNSRLP
jgi:DNA-directed RNA polymerase II subunit RPB1